jgi:hypothetical protein
VGNWKIKRLKMHPAGCIFLYKCRSNEIVRGILQPAEPAMGKPKQRKSLGRIIYLGESIRFSPKIIE